jgi:creatinine amidohydrolase
MGSNSRKIRYEEMLPQEIVEARASYPVAYLPVGGIEWHGEHNPVGLDAIKIHALAMECAGRGGGLVFPPLFYGEPREHYLMEANHDPGDLIKQKMGLSPHGFQPGYMDEHQTATDLRYVELLLHAMKEIRSLAFKVVVVMPGHYPLLSHARAATALFNLQVDKAGLSRNEVVSWAATGYELVRDVYPDAGDHAGAWETSLLMALRPDLVDLSRLPADPKTPLVAVWGKDPRFHASEELGRRAVALIVERITAKVGELLHGLG